MTTSPPQQDRMRGSWMFFHLEWLHDPRATVIARRLNIPRSHVVGALCTVWMYANHQGLTCDETGDCPLGPYIDRRFIDDLAEVDGFADAMEAVELLAEDAGGLTLPRFADKNGKTAKDRALNTHRQQRARAARSAQRPIPPIDPENADPAPEARHQRDTRATPARHSRDTGATKRERERERENNDDTGAAPHNERRARTAPASSSSSKSLPRSGSTPRSPRTVDAGPVSCPPEPQRRRGRTTETTEALGTQHAASSGVAHVSSRNVAMLETAESLLLAAGVSAGTAARLSRSGVSVARVRQVLDEAARRAQAGQLESPSGWIVKAIELDWPIDRPPTPAEKAQAEARARAEAMEQQRVRQQREREQFERERAEEDERLRIFAEENAPQEIERLAKAWIKRQDRFTAKTTSTCLHAVKRRQATPGQQRAVLRAAYAEHTSSDRQPGQQEVAA